MQTTKTDPQAGPHLAWRHWAASEGRFARQKQDFGVWSLESNCPTIVGKQCDAEFIGKADELSQSSAIRRQKRRISSGNQDQRDHSTAWFAIDTLFPICHGRLELSARLKNSLAEPKGQRKCLKPTRYLTKNCCA
ncbi:MAG TPA: hypothetical protein VE914_09695 [Candidatus Angelobacter sp.]|nr:hypothetical protein [Candidatus Angelobacter sp.]